MFLIRKVIARFDKKIAACRKKSTDDPKEESLLWTLKRSLSLRTQGGPYH